MEKTNIGQFDEGKSLAQRNLASGVLFIFCSLLGWVSLVKDENNFSSFLMGGDPGPLFFAKILLTVIAVGGGVVLVHGVIKIRNFTLTDVRLMPVYRHFFPVAFLLSLMSMPFFIREIGSFFSLVLFSLVWVLVLGLKDYQSLPRAIFFSAISSFSITSLVFFVFVKLLNVPLP